MCAGGGTVQGSVATMPPSPQGPHGLTVWNFATLTVTLAFAVILMEHGMEPYEGILHAIGAVAAIIFVIVVPARAVDIYKQGRLVSQLAGHMDLANIITTAVRNAAGSGNPGSDPTSPPADGDGSSTTP